MRRIVALAILAAIAALIVATTPAAVGIAAAALAVLGVGWLMRQPARANPAPVARAAPSPPTVTPAAATDWIETIPCGVLLLTDDLLVASANRAALALCGRSRAEIEGGSLIRAIRDHNIAQIAREAAGLPREVDVRDGQMVRVTATRLASPVGRARLVLALEDLTELRRAQRARSDLVANASHELRTPVTAVLALAETLERGVPDEERRLDFHHRLTNEVTRLSEIIEGLLHLSRLESRSDEFNVVPLDPAELLDTAARRIEPLLSDGQSLELVVDCDDPVDGDRERVLEVLANLLDNALRVSPGNGKVTIAALPGEGEVRFEVRDQGPGIISRDRARVFERFYTGDASRTTSSNSGLGLAIARHIVSRLGGRIWVADRTPGATLCFTLPVSRAAGPRPAVGESENVEASSPATPSPAAD